MNYTKYLEGLENATLFDLFRIKCAIDQILENPERQIGVKRNLHPGMAVTYFEPGFNKLIDAVVIKTKRTQVLVQNKHDGVRWNIPFYMLNLEGVDTSISSRTPSKQLDRASLCVGDQVGFHSKLGVDLYGSIIKLNPKNAKIKLTTGEIWHVSYSLLFPVMESTSQEPHHKHLLTEDITDVIVE